MNRTVQESASPAPNTVQISIDEYRSLQRDSSLLREIRNRLPLTYFVFNLKGETLLQSDNLERLTGYTIEDAMAGHVVRRTNREHMSLLMDAVQKASENRDMGVTTEYTLAAKDDTPLRVRTTFVDMSEHPSFGGIVGFSQIIAREHQLETENHALQSQVARVQQLDGVGTLASGIAHDFNNVLQAVIGNADLISYSLPETADLHKYAERILKAGRTGQNLVTKLLTFARKRPLHKQVVELATCVADAVSLVKVAVTPGVQLTTHIDANAGYLFDDPIHVQQILLNLGTNAIAAVGEGGQVDISLTRQESPDGQSVTIGKLSKQPYARLTVTDNGSGMDEQTTARAFQPFFTTREPEQGTGLGLAVVAGIVEAQGGALDIRSAPSRGTRVDVYLPLISKEEAMTRREDDVAPDGNESVAVIDDDPGVLLVVTNFLERLGYSVAHYDSAKQFLADVTQSNHKFDAVVSDLTMPEMSGIQLARALGELAPELPVILTSGFDEPLQQIASTPPSIKVVLRKPYGAAELGRVIQRVMKDNASPE